MHGAVREVLGFSGDLDGDAFWLRQCPVTKAPIAGADQMKIARAAESVEGTRPSYAPYRVLTGDHHSPRAAQPSGCGYEAVSWNGGTIPENDVVWFTSNLQERVDILRAPRWLSANA